MSFLLSGFSPAPGIFSGAEGCGWLGKRRPKKTLIFIFGSMMTLSCYRGLSNNYFKQLPLNPATRSPLLLLARAKIL
jgi:hypothetical protein